MNKTAPLRVWVVAAPSARVVHEVELELDGPCTVAQAVERSGLWQAAADEPSAPFAVGIWGRKVSPLQWVRDRDRVEIYRPLKVDPKVARRERFVRQGTRGAGLFAKRRATGNRG